LIEYLDREELLRPRKGRKGFAGEGIFIDKEDLLFKRFKRFSGEEDCLLCGSCSCEGFSCVLS